MQDVQNATKQHVMGVFVPIATCLPAITAWTNAMTVIHTFVVVNRAKLARAFYAQNAPQSTVTHANRLFVINALSIAKAAINTFVEDVSLCVTIASTCFVMNAPITNIRVTKQKAEFFFN